MKDFPCVNPLGRSSWHGRLLSVDGTSAADFADDDVAEVLCAGETNPRDWDGDCAAVFRLADGRFVAYETNWGPTGSGFCEDAYGGNADLFFGATAEAVIYKGLSAEGRRLCGLPEEAPSV